MNIDLFITSSYLHLLSEYFNAVDIILDKKPEPKKTESKPDEKKPSQPAKVVSVLFIDLNFLHHILIN